MFEIASFISNVASAVCMVDNLSASGALVSSGLAVAAGEAATLEVEGYGAIPARVIRSRNSLTALEFEFAPGEAEPFREWLAAVEKEDRDWAKPPER
ncbi:MAG: hypothetical protein QF893_13920 [Alphaproteobacteria bacterium]|nr:hypothetical protein [Alphaproteobacteria bacterium]